MNANGTTRILFEEDRTIFSDGRAPDVVLNVGATSIATRLFRHDPPTPGEIERAIDEVEDALAATGLKQTMRGDLEINDPDVSRRLGLVLADERMTRQQIESKFQRLASMSLGHPPAPGEPSTGPMTSAVLLILRECMHHLGYEGLKQTALHR